MFSRDQSVLQKNSPFRARAEEYARRFESLRIIVPAGKGSPDPADDARLRIIPASGVLGTYRAAAREIRLLPRGTVVCTAQEEIGGLVALFASQRFGTPWQLQIHTDVFSPYFRRHSFKNRVRAHIARMLIPRAAVVRVVSRRIAESIKKSGIPAQRIDIVPIYTDIGQFAKIAQARSYENPEFEFTFLMACRLAKEKRVDLAIRAFATVVRDMPKTLLRIVGDGPERAALGVLVRSLGLGTRVQFEGWKENVREFYALDQAFVSSSRYEGYGLAIVEAMASGMPVIATDTGIAGDLLRGEQNGLVVAVDSEEELADAMLRVRKNYELRWKLGRAAADAVSVLESKESYLNRFQESLEACLRKE